ncbi:MAG TPA: vanadium-dependent haloperoxidase [Anaerolineae bacterium]|nr:vanadium-dependent haloperoxidase [Anaerolineae bacterium]
MNRHKTAQILTTIWLLSGLLVACGSAASAPAAGYNAEVATSWFDLFRDLVKVTDGFTPPVASRAFGYAGVTLYEAVAPGMPGYQSLAGQLNGLEPLPQPASGEAYHWPTVANSALAGIARKLFAAAPQEYLAAINSLEDQFVYKFRPNLDPAVFSRSVGQGQLIAYAIYEWSLLDGGKDGNRAPFPASYTPPAGPGYWVSTPPRFQPAMLPAWGNNRPFALKSGDECAPEPPPAFSWDAASPFYREALEVHDAGAGLTPEQTAIAQFWADNPGQTATPSGHSISIVSQVLREKNASLDVAAEAYARVGIAVADSFISCWNTKYKYNLLRPISYIQQVIDPNWTSSVVTPPFPEYTSGHSVQSAAAAQVLTDLFGEDYAFTDRTHEAAGLAARRFSSFFAFAEEAAISRLYGGIHYRAAIEQGLAQGKCIGQRVGAIRFKK